MSARADPDRSAAGRPAQRVGGQGAAPAGTLAADRPFPAIAPQVLAARGSLDSLLVRLIEIELQDCVAASAARRQVDELLRLALGCGATARRANRARGQA